MADSCPKLATHIPSLCINMKLHFLLLVFIFLESFPLNAQTFFEIRGKVQDTNTKSALIGVNILGKPGKSGTTTDENGQFRLRLPAGKVQLEFSYLGYQRFSQNLTLGQDTTLMIELEPTSLALAEIEVEAQKESVLDQVNSTQMSVNKITRQEAKRLPAILGEVDILKIFQLKPGVKSGGEGLAGFYVRGGGADQNLILVNQAPVYNPNHLLGFFSVFNVDAVKSVTLYKAAFPANYGGRLSSVLDVEMEEGNDEKFSARGGIGLISSRLTVEAPLKKNKASITLSGRRTYADVFTSLINRLNADDSTWSDIPRYFFYDLNTQINYKIDSRNHLRLTGYFGNDVFDFSRENFGSRFVWGNRSLSLEWEHRFDQRWSWHNTYFLSAYEYNINNRFGQNSLSLGSSIFDQGLQSELDFQASEQQSWKLGLSTIYHRFSVGNFGIATDFSDLEIGERLQGVEWATFAATDWSPHQRWQIYAGLRLSGFMTHEKNYYGLEPRLGLRYSLDAKTTLKFSYTRMYQYLHLVGLSSASLPTDIWYPSTGGVEPQFSDQLVLGLNRSLANDRFYVSLEGYYKWLHNSLDFKDGAQLFANPNLETEFVFGRGWAYGLEFYIEKKQGKTTGWLGYTLSWTWREFSEINEGRAFRPRYDRRHDVSAVLMHEISPRVFLSATWVYGTGNYTSLATGRFVFQDIVSRGEPENIDAVPLFLGRNDYQLPPSHRLDLGLVWKLNSRWGESDLTFSIYNVYSRRNPFFIFFEEQQTGENQTTGFEAKMVTLFPIIPAVTYNFKF